MGEREDLEICRYRWNFHCFPISGGRGERMRPRLHVCSGDTPFPAEVFLSGKGEITEVRKECRARKENA